MLFDQVDRLRLSTYMLVRLRDQLGERDNQRSDAEGDAADLLDAVLRSTAQLLNTVANELIAKNADDLSNIEADLRQLSETAQRRKEECRASPGRQHRSRH